MGEPIQSRMFRESRALGSEENNYQLKRFVSVVEVEKGECSERVV